MAAIALRPRTTTEIVDAAFQIFRAHFALMVTCAALACIPHLALRLLIGDPRRLFGALSTDALAVTPELLWMTLAGSVGSWLTFALMSAVLIVCTSQAYLGQEVNVGVAVKHVAPRLPTILIASLIRFAMFAVALIFFFVPVLYVATRYFAVTTTIVLEDSSLVGGFSRSSELSRGRKWHVLMTIGLVVLIYWVLLLGVSLAASLFGSFILETVVDTVVTAMVYPVVAITQTLLYYDARIQREGLDIELMAAALAPVTVG